MSRRHEHQVRPASEQDAGELALMLHAFNTEFGDPVPEVEVLTERIAEHIREGHSLFWLVGGGPDGFASLRLRPSLATGRLEAYLEELYVKPELRGQGLGRTLLERVMDDARQAGADRMDLGTSTDDAAARALYEKLGFTNLERPGGPSMLFYERDL